MTPKVQTVTGDIHPDKLGRTLTHEHICMKFSHFYRNPPPQIKHKFDDKIDLLNVGFVKQYPYSSQYNLIFNDDDTRNAMRYELDEYKKYGGGTIVENSTEGLERDVKFLYNLSRETGVKIVAGTGYYIADVQTESSLSTSKEAMYNHMLKEMTECVQIDSWDQAENIRTGFIGEVASDWPIKDFERRAIIAAGEVQEQIGCGVSFHPHRNPDAPFEIIRLYLEAGGRVHKVVMSHLDRTILDDERFLEFGELGTYCQLDLFGTEVSMYQLHVQTDMPSDSQRLDKIKLLIDDGKEDRILMSHDIHTKHRLSTFGGHGYFHIINNVLPKMRIKGISEDVIDKITIVNPSTWLSIGK